MNPIVRMCVLLAVFTFLEPAGARAGQLAVAGIPNCATVNSHLMRGGQPEGDAWSRLAALGVKVVVDLRRVEEHSTVAERAAVEAAGMRYVNVPMSGLSAPNARQIAAALAVIVGPDPVFIHCKQGKDRTGTVVALYRISHDHWNNDQALDEAESRGLHWYERGMKHLIRSYHLATAPVATSVPAAPADSLALAGAALQR